jgi:hypothetical protein
MPFRPIDLKDFKTVSKLAVCLLSRGIVLLQPCMQAFHVTKLRVSVVTKRCVLGVKL